MIKVFDLSKRFDTLQAVDHLSFEIREGEIFGFLGPNGAGKTTTVKMMVGMLKPDSGLIEINGFNTVRDPLKVKSDLGYVPESSALYENLTGREHLEMICNSITSLPIKSITRSEDCFRPLNLWNQQINALPDIPRA